MFTGGAVALIAGLNNGNVDLIIAGSAGTILGLVFLVLAFVTAATSDDASPLTHNRTFLPTPNAPAGEQFQATIVRLRNTNMLQGVNRFSTEVILDVHRGGQTVAGFARQFLTPVQIASLVPGSTVLVTAASGLPDKYTIVLDEWVGGQAGSQEAIPT